jgi:hypothetical protein
MRRGPPSSAVPMPRRCHASATRRANSPSPRPWTLDETADADDLALTRVGIGVLHDEREGPVVVDEADPGQALVRRPLGELEVAEVPRVDGFGERPSWKRTIAARLRGGSDEASAATPSGVVHSPTYSRGIGSDRRAWQALVGELRRMEDDPRIERDEAAPAEARSGLTSISADPGQLDDEPAEANEDLLERGEVDGLATPHPLQRPVDLRALHHPTGEGRVERGQAQRAVAQHLDELARRARRGGPGRAADRWCCR